MAKQQRISFDEFYTLQWGDRWQTLKSALQQPARHFSLQNTLMQTYYLDPASVWAAELLPLPGESGSPLMCQDSPLQILDMCAAPGGKSLVLLQRLIAAWQPFHLTANDRSSQRRRRLHNVLDTHLPDDIPGKVTVTGHDACRWGLHEKDRYDLIIADVPCSSEAHVIQSPAHLQQWSAARAKRLAQQAYTILLAALDAVAPNGIILYSTCSVNSSENDGVVKRVLKRRAEQCSSIDLQQRRDSVPHWLDTAEQTEYGYQILPDTSTGAGPLYAALLRKTHGG